MPTPADSSRARTLAPSVSAPAALALALLLSGCSFGPGLEAGFDAPDPGARLHAIEDAAAEGTHEHIPDLIGALDSSDAAERMLAIRALERVTGQTLGYDYSDPPALRKAAIGRWHDWWNRNPPAEIPDPAVASPDVQPPPERGDHGARPPSPM